MLEKILVIDGVKMAGVRFMLMYLAQQLLPDLEQHRARGYGLTAFSAAQAFSAPFFKVFFNLLGRKIIIKPSFYLGL